MKVLHLNNITLVPLAEDHLSGLIAAAADGEIWKLQHQQLDDQLQFKTLWFEKALKQMQNGKRQAWVVEVDNIIVGSSSLYNKTETTISIGYTWFNPSCWGKKINAGVKYLLLKYAFDKAGYQQVKCCIDKENLMAKYALEKIGFVQQEIIRKHFTRHDGSWRDSIIYIVNKEAWSKMKTSLWDYIHVK